MPVRVTPDQFVITKEGITHILTGARLIKIDRNPQTMKLERGQLDRDSDHPEEHNPDAVIKMLTSYGTKQILTRRRTKAGILLSPNGPACAGRVFLKPRRAISHVKAKAEPKKVAVTAMKINRRTNIVGKAACSALERGCPGRRKAGPNRLQPSSRVDARGLASKGERVHAPSQSTPRSTSFTTHSTMVKPPASAHAVGA